jgi:hypothetical protein
MDLAVLCWVPIWETVVLTSLVERELDVGGVRAGCPIFAGIKVE